MVKGEYCIKIKRTCQVGDCSRCYMAHEHTTLEAPECNCELCAQQEVFA